VRLVICQSLLIAHSRRLPFIPVDFPDLLQHVVTRLRIDSPNLHEFPSRVDQTLADDSLPLAAPVAGQGVGHLDRRRGPRTAQLVKVFYILTRMLAPVEIERHPSP